GKASFDFTYSYSVDPGVVTDIVRPTASANPPPAAAQPTSAEALYKPTVDVASRSATLKANVRDVDTCRPLGSKALARDATGFAGLPAEDEANCRDGVVDMVSSCAAAFLMGRQSFDFDYTFKVSSKADGDKKIPIVDVESRSASLKTTVASSDACNSLGCIALERDASGFCSGLSAEDEAACRNGVAK
ncbi:hypothetical protein HK405_007960, partial [Cladochytrium tenue]